MTINKINTEIITNIQIKNLEQVKKFCYFGSQNANENIRIKEIKNIIVIVKLTPRETEPTGKPKPVNNYEEKV